MKHTNTGSEGHTNTGYANHVNTYANHTNTYNNHTNTYGNHSNYYTHTGNKYDPSTDIDYSLYNDIDYSIYEDRSNDIQLFAFGGSSSYGDMYRDYRNTHVNTGAAHQNSGAGGNNHKQYVQSGSGGNNHQQYTQSGYNNHANTGYTNHVNTNINVEPTAPTNMDLGVFAYYKDTIKLVWQKAQDNNKCISVISAGFGSAGTSGIYEQGTIKAQASRGTTIGYWDLNGIWQGSTIKDTMTDISMISALQTYYNGIPNGSFVAFSTHDAIFPAGQEAVYRNFLSAYGFTKANLLDGYRSSFAGILKKGTGVLSESAHRYGQNPVSAGTISAQYTIPNVLSGQTMTYTIEYSFKPIGQSTYGTWTKIADTTLLEYSYSLSNHGNGFIKFRILASDGVESATTYLESKEVRVLKYVAPNMPVRNRGDVIMASDFNTIIVEINKLAEATGVAATPLVAVPNDIIKKSDAIEINSKHSELNNIVQKTSSTINENEEIKATNVENIKKWLKEI